MTMTIPELARAFEQRMAVKGWITQNGTVEKSIRKIMDYCRGLILGNFFRGRNDLEYQTGKYFEENEDCADLQLGLHSVNAVPDFIGACLDATKEEIDETGSAKVVTVAECSDDIFKLYEKGFDTGIRLDDWKWLSEKFRVAKKQLTVLTGMGGVGKSTWLDNYLVKLAEQTEWKILFYSPENFPIAYHIEKLVSIKSGRPFFLGKNERASPQEIVDAMAWVDKHFYFITSDDNATLEVILNVFRKTGDEKKIDVCVIDPWNTVEHKRPEDQSETEYICESLTKCLGFVRRRDVAMFVVAHPSKMRRGKDGTFPAPTPYEISGCYSSDTEVLTENGWKVHEEIDINKERICCFDFEKNKLKYLYPSVNMSIPYSGKMHQYSGYSLDLLVSPRHRMVLQAAWNSNPGKWKHEGWQFEESRKLKNAKYRMPLSALLEPETTDEEFRIPGVVDQVAAWAFAGWYVTEGWVAVKSPAICQAEDNHFKPKNIIQRLRIPYGEAVRNYNKNEKPIWTARIKRRGHEDFCDWIIKNCGSGCVNKKMPDSIWSMPKHIKEVFFESLISGDGSRRKYVFGRIRQGGYQFSTTSKKLADQMQRLAMELGMYSSLTSCVGAKEHYHEKYNINIGNRSRTERVIVIPRNRKIVEYDGRIHCLTVPTGAYVTRRNGKISICGNSAHWANRPDNNLTIHREENGRTSLIVNKIRFRMYGEIGTIPFKYDRMTNIFSEENPNDPKDFF